MNTQRAPGAFARPFAGTTFRSQRLRDALSVESLNRYFRDGWHVIAINVDGVSYLPPVGARNAMSIVDRRSHVEVVLAGSETRCRQSALFMRQNALGRVNVASVPAHMNGWARTLLIVTDSGDGVALYEREE
jgi:hypothetical protein